MVASKPGGVKLRLLHKGQIKILLADKLRGGLSRNSVRIIHATVRAMLNAAVDDGIILANPADKLGRTFRLVTPTASRLYVGARDEPEFRPLPLAHR